MSKKDNLMKGFNNLLQSTESIDKIPKQDIKNNSSLDVKTSESLDAQKFKHVSVVKYKELRKCTLYLPPEIIDSLAIMKVKTKKDLSELTAEALREYLINNKFLNV